MLLLCALSGLALAGETIHDLELGLKLEVPYATPSVLDATLGEGDSELHFGFRGDFHYVMTERLAISGAIATRRQYLSFDMPEDEILTVLNRTLRLEAGARVSLLEPPTFLVFTGGVGWVSAWWGLNYTGLTGDRVTRGGGAHLGVGVDHFLNPRFALSGELRGWGELYPPEEVSAGPYSLSMPPGRVGASLLVGFTFR